MHHDLTRITVRPATTGKALPLLGAWLEGASSKARLLGCWISEIGALNDILVLRGYEDAATLAADRDALTRGPNPFGIAEFTTAIAMDTWVPFPFVEPIAAGQVGPIFEVRTYRLKADGLAGTIEAWQKALPARLRLSSLVTAMYSTSSAVPRFMHIWPYKSLNERQDIRGKAIEAGIWPPPGGAERLLEQKTEIFLAAPFSPLR
jgi:hypothetical protein